MFLSGSSGHAPFQCILTAQHEFLFPFGDPVRGQSEFGGTLGIGVPPANGPCSLKRKNKVPESWADAKEENTEALKRMHLTRRLAGGYGDQLAEQFPFPGKAQLSDACDARLTQRPDMPTALPSAEHADQFLS